jgi:hypothetical protein
MSADMRNRMKEHKTKQIKRTFDSKTLGMEPVSVLVANGTA